MVLIDVLSVVRSHRFAPSLLISDVVLMAGYFGLVLGTRTKVGNEGIQIRRFGFPSPLRRWAEIASIQEEEPKVGCFRLRVRLADGKQFALPCPLRTPGKFDPAYDTQRDQILTSWRRMSTDPGKGN